MNRYVAHLLLLGLLNGQVDTLWTKIFHYEDSDKTGGYFVNLTSDGGYIATGERSNDLFLIKTDSEGNEEWTYTFGDTSSGIDDYGNYVQQTSDGGYIVIGETESFASGIWDSDMVLIKLNPFGVEEWFQIFGDDGPNPGISGQQTTDGGYVLLSRDSNDITLIKTDQEGNEVWNKTLLDEENVDPHRIEQTNDGGFAIFGRIGIEENGWDFLILKTDEEGNQEWYSSYGDTDNQNSSGVQKGQATSDGGYINVGTIYPNGSAIESVWLIKSDSLGQFEWSKTFNYYNEMGISVIQTLDGGYMIMARSFNYSSYNIDVLLIKTDGEGNEQWNKIIFYDGYPLSIQQSPNGTFIITGRTNGPPWDFDMFLLKTNADSLHNADMSFTPSKILVNQNYPNPFNPSTTLNFSIPFSDNVNIRVLDIVGREVDVLMNEYLTNGNHSLEWDGREHPSGIYFISFESGGFVETQKVVLMK